MFRRRHRARAQHLAQLMTRRSPRRKMHCRPGVWQTNHELIAALEAGGEVTRVPVYQWEMPEDTGPLAKLSAVSPQGVRRRPVHNSVQADHLMEMRTGTSGRPHARRSRPRRHRVHRPPPRSPQWPCLQPDFNPPSQNGIMVLNSPATSMIYAKKSGAVCEVAGSAS